MFVGVVVLIARDILLPWTDGFSAPIGRPLVLSTTRCSLTFLAILVDDPATSDSGSYPYATAFLLDKSLFSFLRFLVWFFQFLDQVFFMPGWVFRVGNSKL